ncbi:hypothetical protein OG455_10215 [Kitasatospora sp. NBC_01287]|uniref:hypothetical protein n=1 Tax=Kitasatospora sp. NBC_01287 TaxID=2903573 RepID=UPI002257A194|nr:hypothetical protein [Kitasatospora sp. NBC_01287]MCX4745894.1 hypothetical protein [Kitasatospora sp. NBC_01287]
MPSAFWYVEVVAVRAAMTSTPAGAGVCTVVAGGELVGTSAAVEPNAALTLLC